MRYATTMRTKKLKMENILFDMDAHASHASMDHHFTKKKIFFSCDFPKLFHCSCDAILTRLKDRGINRHVKNHLPEIYKNKIYEYGER